MREKRTYADRRDYLIKAHFTPGEIVEKIRATLQPQKAQSQ